MVAANIGITLMPELATEKRSSQVKYLPFKGEPPHREIGLCWRTTTTRGELLREFGEVLQATTKDMFTH